MTAAGNSANGFEVDESGSSTFQIQGLNTGAAAFLESLNSPLNGGISGSPAFASAGSNGFTASSGLCATPNLTGAI